MRDWKNISKALSEIDGEARVLLDYPYLEWGDLPEWSAPYEHRKPSMEKAHNPTPKEIRQFLWEHRNKRSIERDRAFVWKRYNPDLETFTVGLGTLTVAPVVERLSNGIEEPDQH